MSVGNILSKLKEFNNSNLVSVYIPSAKRELSFRPLSVKQQKDLIKSGLDGILAGITISNTINSIILENCTEKYKFLVTDKIPVILALRRQSFGSIFTVKDEEKETIFDLDEILKNDLKYSTDETAWEIQFNGEDFSVFSEIVSLEDDIKINEFQLDKLKKLKDEQLSETVGSLFIYEILKFVSKIQMDKDVLELNTLPIKDRLNVIENVPATINNNVLQYVQLFRKEESDYITVNGNVLPIDARLFSKE
jgi:hypothetical protein